MSKIQLTATDIKVTREEVRTLLCSADAPEEIVVTVPSGIYLPENFSFTDADCSECTRVTYSAEEGAVISGGITIPSSEWKLPDDEMLERFPEESRDKIRMISLSEYGLTREDWGEEIAIGAYNTANKYDDAPKSCGSEFFCGNRRMIKARYPNAGTFAKLEAVMDVGDVWEFPPQNYNLKWKNRRNHRGGTYIVDAVTNERIKKWRTPETAWIFGYLYWDWADSSSPISEIDTAIRAISPKYVSNFGAQANALYYLYNIPEELDCEGEWYLERTSGNLYFYPWEGADSADFSCGGTPLINCKNTKNMTFSGFTLCCTMNNAVEAEGDDMIFENLVIKNIAKNGVKVTGYRNTVRRCDISHMGEGGIVLTGGERMTLTPGENRAEDNLIDSFGEIFMTYRPGIGLNGVGNVASHNEISNTPHCAILYGGNEHLIEYNYIHDVVLLSSDASAIYGGRDVVAHGTVIRYNKLKNIGANGFTPQGIYFDDVLSGQTAYGNIIIDVGNWGFLIGGGREITVENNLIVNSGGAALQYDSRAHDGLFFNSWYKHIEGHWAQVQSIPRNEEPWISRYPKIADMHSDVEAPDSPDLLVNPAYSSVKNNIAIECNELYCVSDLAKKFSYVDENHLYASKAEAGYDDTADNLSPDSVVYKEHPEFKPIPVNEIGIRR